MAYIAYEEEDEDAVDIINGGEVYNSFMLIMFCIEQCQLREP